MKIKNTEYRSLGRCIYCNEEIFGRHPNKKQAHQRFCKFNPNREKSLNQIKDAAKIGSIVSLENNREKYEKANEKHKYIFTCKKCGNEYELELTDTEFKRGDYSKHCSYKCSNSRIHTKETNKKVSDTLHKQRKHTCPICHEEFLHNGINVNRTLCDKCYLKKYGHLRPIRIETIGNNGKKVKIKIGNNTELHEVDCLNCHKHVFCKTSDDVYCYECAKKLNKRVYQLYDCNGKRIVSDETRLKISKLVQERIKNGTHVGWKVRPIASYPEKFWMNVLKNNNIYFDFNYYISKKSLNVNKSSGYFLDFKLYEKFDLEIDGKQHLYSKRKASDKERDILLKNNGWVVYRILWNEINSDNGKKKMEKKINDFLNYYNNYLKDD